MKKILFVIGLLTFVSAVTFAGNNPYKVDANQVESLFANAQEISMPSFETSSDFSPLMVGQNQEVLKSKKNPWVAVALCWVVGGLGIHRMYLGTKPMTWIGYILTCGGIFGVVPLVDFVVLIVGAIEKDIRDYVDNPAFFMWG
jgi:TM2 domain-containing membrane protein YozV